jgi:hypothetical protein
VLQPAEVHPLLVRVRVRVRPAEVHQLLVRVRVRVS